MRFTAETCRNVRVLEMQNFIPAYMKGWKYVGTYPSRRIFSEPKFLGCIDYQIFLPMVLLNAPFAHARALLLKQPQNRFGCDSQNHEEGIRRHYHESSDCDEYPKSLFQIKPPQKIPEEKISIIPVTWDPQYAPFLPGQPFLKSRYCVGKNTLFNDLFVSILKVETDAGINIPGYILSQIKGKYKNVTIPPNIATRANTCGPFLFQCCRVVFNKDKNRLELPKGEVVGKPVNRCKEDEEEEYKNTAVSLLGNMENSLIGKINICFRLNYSGLLVTNPVPRVIPLFPRICMYLHYFTFLLNSTQGDLEWNTLN